MSSKLLAMNVFWKRDISVFWKRERGSFEFWKREEVWRMF